MAKKKILKDNGKEILPITHESCVLDNNGVSIDSKIGNINELATDSKTDLVSAINDILYYKNIIKQENEELKQEKNDTFIILLELMKKGGYDVNNDMNISDLLGVLEISGVKLGEVKQVACGYNHTAIVKIDGSLWTCGDNSYGELGLGNTTQKTAFTQVTTNINNDVKYVCCGNHFTYIIKNDGTVWSCGDNTNGQLGLGNTTQKTTFTQVTTNIDDVKQIVCGYYFATILKSNGSVWTTGYNDVGQLGLGNNSTKTSFTQVTTNIDNDVKQIACGENYLVALKNDGTLWTTGYNYYGQLGINSTTNVNKFTQVTTNINNDVKQIACGRHHTFILKNDGTVWSCGNNTYGQLGINSTTNKTSFTQVTTNIDNDVKQIIGDAANHHIIILKTDGSVWTCGYNNYGQLGFETTASYKVFTQVTSDNNNKQIACGGHHTFILKNDGTLWSCGYNSNGQLGLNVSDNNIHGLIVQVTTNILSNF